MIYENVTNNKVVWICSLGQQQKEFTLRNELLKIKMCVSLGQCNYEENGTEKFYTKQKFDTNNVRRVILINKSMQNITRIASNNKLMQI